MQNSTDFYRSEINYRQAQIRRDWQPIRARRAMRAALRKSRRSN